MIERIREQLKTMLHMGESPDRLAWAFAVGVFIGFSPLIGLHTIMAAGMVWGFRMNPIAVFTGAYLTNPWTAVPIYAGCTWLGLILWPGGADLAPLSMEGLTLKGLFTQMRPYLMPFVVGTLVVGTVAALVSFGVMRWVVVSYRRQRGLDTTPEPAVTESGDPKP